MIKGCVRQIMLEYIFKETEIFHPRPGAHPKKASIDSHSVTIHYLPNKKRIPPSSLRNAQPHLYNCCLFHHTSLSLWHMSLLLSEQCRILPLPSPPHSRHHKSERKKSFFTHHLLSQSSRPQPSSSHTRCRSRPAALTLPSI